MSSRRAFFGAAGVGAAAVGLTSMPGIANAAATPLTEKVVLTVVDAAKGEFLINVGEIGVPITDKDFAAKLKKAIG